VNALVWYIVVTLLVAAFLLQAIAKIPWPTLAALLSIRGVDARLAAAQLKLLAAQDADTINKLVFFTSAVSGAAQQLLATIKQACCSRSDTGSQAGS
jgi:MFS superfamily sulfate permease-like transporter